MSVSTPQIQRRKITITICRPRCVFRVTCNSFHSLATRYVRQTETEASLIVRFAFLSSPAELAAVVVEPGWREKIRDDVFLDEIIISRQTTRKDFALRSSSRMALARIGGIIEVRLPSSSSAVVVETGCGCFQSSRKMSTDICVMMR